MKLSRLFVEFFESERAAGLILVFVTIISLLLANSQWLTGYSEFWNKDLGGHSLVYWINDGLMSIFFLLIGLELEREIYLGELSDFRRASLPVFGALGGMVFPAVLFILITAGTTYQRGAGIPMATDIAFAVGILSLLGNKVPASLKVFLIALAVIDDLGAILIIAVFYTSSISFLNLLAALCILGILILLNRLKINHLVPYIAGGLIMWYFMLKSGVHPTITGVMLAFAIPFRDGGEKSPSFILQHFLHKPVAFLILPVFALANTAFIIAGNVSDAMLQTYSTGILVGLVFGKPLGIFLFAWIASLPGLCFLPEDLKWRQIFSAACLGGIGFTMSIFITLLAFENSELISNAKIAILISSVISGVIGYILLKVTLKGNYENDVI